jgi:hypothetical protein
MNRAGVESGLLLETEDNRLATDVGLSYKVTYASKYPCTGVAGGETAEKSVAFFAIHPAARRDRG